MAKTVSKKSSSASKSKTTVDKKQATKKIVAATKKTKSVTPKKSVTKKSVKAKSNTLKLTKSVLPKHEIKEPEPINTEPDYGSMIFEVMSNEVGFLKLPDNTFLVKATKGVKVRRKDELNFELFGKNEDGTDFSTIFECLSKEESEQLISELTNFSNIGEVSTIKTETNTTENMNGISTEEGENQIHTHEDTQEEYKPRDLSEFNGVPLKVEDMTEIINTMKVNNHNNSVSVPTPAPVQNAPLMVNPINPHTQNFASNTPAVFQHNAVNAVVPSQNPFANESNNPHMTNPVINVSSGEQKFNELKLYAKSIEDNINSTFQVRVQGGLPKSELMNVLNSCSKDFTYDVKNDGKGLFLTVTQGEYQLRVPENPMEYLKVV